MTLKTLIILPEAEQDANQAYSWYEEQQSGLGEEFFRCIDARINSIQRNPEIYPIVGLSSSVFKRWSTAETWRFIFPENSGSNSLIFRLITI
jgi:hypothetical protein